jgi:hypothetical protein
VDATKVMLRGVTEVMSQLMSLQSNIMSQMTSLQNTMLNMANSMIQSSQKRSLADELAEYYQLKKVIKLILEEEGARASASELDQVFGFIERALALGKRVEEVRSAMASASTSERVTPEAVPEAVKKAMMEAEEKLEEAMVEANEKLDQAFAICREVEGEKCA